MLLGAALLLTACGTSEASPDAAGQIATLETPVADEQAAGADLTVATDGETDQATADELTFEDAQLEFSQCMRDSGYADYPDPDPSATGRQDGGFGGGVDLEELGIDRRDPEFREAQQLCREVFSGVAGVGQDLEPEQQAELEDTIIELFACVREQPGYEDLPDPEFGGGGLGGALGAIFQSGDIDQQELLTVLGDCRESLGIEGFGGQNGGPGFGRGGAPAGPASDDDA